MRRDGLRPQVRHQRQLQAREEAQHVHALLVDQPRHAVRGAGVQATVRRQQSERHPALVQRGRRCSLEAADVVTPEAEAAEAQRQAAAQALGHALEGRVAVAAPVHRELLPARRGAAREQRGLAGPLGIQRTEHGRVVQLRVVVVHPVRVAAIKPNDALVRDALPEVRLDGVHALPRKPPDVARKPRRRVRVREIHDAHARLPQVALPHPAVRAAQQVALARGLREQRGLLRDVRVDPHAHPQAPFMQAGQHALRVGKHGRVPLEVAPLEGLHPEAVEVEHRQRNLPFPHAVKERGHGPLVVVGGKRRAQPQSETPRGRQGRAARQARVALQHLGRGRPGDHQIFQRLARHAELHARDPLAGDLERHRTGIVHEHAVPLAAQVERHVLVRLVAARAAVAVPDVHRLPVLHEGREALAQPVHEFAHVQRQALVHEGLPVVAADVAYPAPGRAGQRFAAVQEAQAPREARDFGPQRPAREGGERVVDLDHHRRVLPADVEVRAGIRRALEVRDAHANDARQR